MRAASSLWIAATTAAALTGFAANSLLCRLALGERAIDPSSFTSVRLASGALALALLARRSRRAPAPRARGSWGAALALFAYAASFSFAYVRLGAAVGALILFACVQATMLAWGLREGERPSARVWSGLALALGGLAALALAGDAANDPAGLVSMALAGVSWGAYCLLGRKNEAPLAATAGNFLRSLPLAALLSLLALPHAHASPRGLALALASGALASGVGYSLWYAALPHLSATRAAVVQLAVPVLAAAGAVLLLGETLSVRLCASGVAILGGVALALGPERARRSVRSR